MTMRLTTKTRYGMRAITELAVRYNQGPVSVSYISKKEGISISYLEQLLNTLKRNGIVRSIRGPQGGYVLAKGPADIKVYDIVRVLEGDLALVFCIEEEKNKKNCEKIDECISRLLWKKLNDSIKDILNSVSVEDLCQGFDASRKQEKVK